MWAQGPNCSHFITILNYNACHKVSMRYSVDILGELHEYMTDRRNECDTVSAGLVISLPASVQFKMMICCVIVPQKYHF